MTTTFAKWTDSLSDQQRADVIRFWSRNASSSPFALSVLESLCDDMGLMLISKQTDALLKRLEAGAPLAGAELERLSYAIAAATPPKKD